VLVEVGGREKRREEGVGEEEEGRSRVKLRRRRWRTAAMSGGGEVRSKIGLGLERIKMERREECAYL
jgi:hypothetical protein